MKYLGQNSKILPVTIPFFIKGYENQCKDSITFAPGEIECNTWFLNFKNRIINALGSKFLPVCRISDGEFQMMLGLQWMNHHYPVKKALRNNSLFLLKKIAGYEKICARTLPLVYSGRYSSKQVKEGRQRYLELITDISQKGILAIHLTMGKKPFQENYFESFKKYVCQKDIFLDFGNYVPFYFVYPLLTGEYRFELIKDKKVLLIHSADGLKKEKIIDSLYKTGAKMVHWLSISKDKSMYDKLNVYHLCGAVDIAFVGAGIGKPNILSQLELLNIPCIDAGYVFEIWANPQLGTIRPLCSLDSSTK